VGLLQANPHLKKSRYFLSAPFFGEGARGYVKAVLQLKVIWFFGLPFKSSLSLPFFSTQGIKGPTVVGESGVDSKQ